MRKCGAFLFVVGLVVIAGCAGFGAGVKDAVTTGGAVPGGEAAGSGYAPGVLVGEALKYVLSLGVGYVTSYLAHGRKDSSTPTT